ncbi:MAG: glycoside hydrolase family 127 protein, partial [Bacteroidaceae bacterium]|nr:glycoside hydrolase family 127 protein [Bacteroidaceae bacterium]
MKKIVTFVCLLCLGLAARAGGEIKQVPFTDVQVKDLFWKQRLDVMRNITIRYAFQKCTDAGQLRNFEYAGKIVSGEAQVGDLKFQSGNPYDDAEVY